MAQHVNEKALRVEFASKLASVKAEVESQLREEFQREVDELRQLIQEERSEVSRQKSNLNIKAKHLRDFKTALIKESDAREEAYAEAVESLRFALAEKETELDQLREICGRITFEGEAGDQVDEMKDREVDQTRLRSKNRTMDVSNTSEINSQKQRELDYKVSPNKEIAMSHTREITPHFSNQPAYNDEIQPSSTARFMKDSASREEIHYELDDPFEIKPSRDCQIYAESLIKRELARLKSVSVEEHYSKIENPYQASADIILDSTPLTYSSTRRFTRDHDPIVLQTSSTQRDSKKSVKEKNSIRSRLSEDNRDDEIDQIDLDLKCKGLLDFILFDQPLDDDKTILMKERKQGIIKENLKNEVMVPRVQGLLKLLCSKYDSQSSILQEHSNYFSKLIKLIESEASTQFYSNKEKLQIFNDLDSIEDVHSSIIVARKYLDKLKKQKEKFKTLYELMSVRNKLRIQLEFLSQEFDSVLKISEFNRTTSSIYSLLRSKNKEIISFLHKNPANISYKIPGFKGCELIDLISLDFWEEDYLRKLEGRLLASKARFK